MLLVFESIRARPEAVVLITNQLLSQDQSFESLTYEFFFRSNAVKDFLVEDKEPAIA